MQATERVLGFDYEALGANDREAAQAAAVKVKTMLDRTTESVIAIGRELIEMRRRLGSRDFRRWAKAEFQFTLPVTSNYMRIARKFGELDCKEKFDPSALVLLARDSAPASAIKEAIGRAQGGEYISRKTSQGIINRHAKKAVDEEGDKLAAKVRGYLYSVVIPGLNQPELLYLADVLMGMARNLKRKGKTSC